MLTLIATGWPYLTTILTLGSITGAAWALQPRPRDERLRRLAAHHRARVAEGIAEREADEAFARMVAEISHDFPGEAA